MTDAIQEMREKIAAFAYEFYHRRLTDAAGGNFSVRMGDVILMTPKMAGTNYHWKIKPSQVLILTPDGKKLEGDGEISREAKVHFSLLAAYYPVGTSVVHTHARNVLVFCAAEKPIPPVLDATRKFGVIPLSPYYPSGTKELADAIVETIRPSQHRIAKGGAACIVPRHGLFVIGKDFYSALDSTERIDTNCYCIAQGSALGELTPWLEGAAAENPAYE